MAPGLCFKIMDYLEELGLLVPGKSVVIDPMCGVATSLLCGAIKGYETIGVELEEKFVGLATQNMERLATKMEIPNWQIIQGDSRYLASLLDERGLCAIMSQPYSNPRTEAGDLSQDDYDKRMGHDQGKGAYRGRYGDSPGQIGKLRDKPAL